MAGIKLEDINGNEIIAFLETKHEEFDKCSFAFPIIFEGQEIVNGKYELEFNCYFNNWGTEQLIENNYIYIEESGECWVSLNEPHDSDSSTDIMEDLLKKWLSTHVFKSQEEDFYNILKRVYELLPDLTSNNIKMMDELIQQMTLAKTMMK